MQHIKRRRRNMSQRLFAPKNIYDRQFLAIVFFDSFGRHITPSFPYASFFGHFLVVLSFECLFLGKMENSWLWEQHLLPFIGLAPAWTWLAKPAGWMENIEIELYCQLYGESKAFLNCKLCLWGLSLSFTFVEDLHKYRSNSILFGGK